MLLSPVDHAARRTLIVTVYFVTVLVAAAAAGSSLRFEHLTPKQGLSQYSANAILQDSKGFLWIGTQDGLNRFDGHTVEVFKHDPDDPDSLAESNVLGLTEDSRGGIWVILQAAGVISRFDIHTETFSRYLLQGQGPPYPVNPLAVVEDQHGSMWIGTFGSGIFRLDLEWGGMVQLLAQGMPQDGAGNEPVGLSSNVISVILRDSTGTLWIGTAGGGLLRAHATGGVGQRFDAFTFHSGSPTGLPSDTVTAIFEDRSGDLWVGTVRGGLARKRSGSKEFEQYHRNLGSLAGSSVLNVLRAITEDLNGALWVLSDGGMTRIDPDRSHTVHYRNDQTGSRQLQARIITSQIVDSQGRVWVACANTGLYLYDAERDTFVSVRNDPSDPQSLSADFVVSITEDRSGLLWFGTTNGGANRFSWAKNRFRQLTPSPLRPHSLTGSKVFAMLIHSSGSLWVATLEGGLHQLDPSRERVVRRYTDAPGAETDIGSNHVRAVCEDHRQSIWVGTTTGGVAMIDPVAGVVRRRYRNDPGESSSLSNNQVNSFLEDSQHRLWVCTALGLNLLDTATGRCQRFYADPADRGSLPSNFVRFVSEDPQKILWVGTVGGLARFDETHSRVTQYVAVPGEKGGLSNNNIMDLYNDGRGSLWIATYGGGLNRLDLATGTFAHYTERDGLPTDSLYSVVPDRDGHLWLSSNRGISRFDIATETFHTFHADDGVGGEEFNGRSFWQAEDGELFFGGMHGLSSFYPSQIKLSSYQPPVVLRAFRRFEQPQRFPVAIDEVEQLVLSHRDSFFSFEFVALDFTNPQRNRYAYMLEGFDRDWIACDRRYVSYTNLDGGSYRFRVRASNSDGVWSEHEVALPVIIVPPPWQTWWAYLLYALAVFAAISSYLRYRFQQQEQKVHRLQEQAEATRKTEELEKARAIQLSLLPASPPRIESLDIAAYMKTATEVGGDYYDFFPRENPDGEIDTLYVVVGDATGHGISAGMMVSMLKAALKALDLQPPHVLLTKLNRVIRAVNPERMSMALAIACLDIGRGEITLSSAGMPPGYLLVPGTAGAREVLVPSVPLGALEEPGYSVTTQPFVSGDAFVMLSDGLPELRDGLDRELGYEAVQQQLAGHERKSAREILEGLVELGQRWSGGRANQDDITIVVMRRR